MDNELWIKSTKSGSEGSCVEVNIQTQGEIKVRDSKLGDNSPILHFTPAEWRAFREGVLIGEFDF